MTGKKGFGYKSSCFCIIVVELMYQGGDFVCHNGMGSKSISGERFDDECFILKYTGPRILSRANLDPAQMVPSVSSALPKVRVGWQACGLWQHERGHEYCGNHEVFGPGIARPAGR